MSAGTTPQQGRLLPYLVVALLVLLGYVGYTQLLSPRGPQALPPPVEPQGAAGRQETPQPAPAHIPTPAAAGTGTAIPARPAGRPNPFAPLVSAERPSPARVSQPAAPLPPPVPPPHFPGAGERGEEARTAFRATGVVVVGGARVAVLQVGERTYFARTGDVVEGFRVVEVRPEVVRVRSGTAQHEFTLREVAAP